ncbi:carbohydrate ABC transporter permease [Cohnella sp.]
MKGRKGQERIRPTEMLKSFNRFRSARESYLFWYLFLLPTGLGIALFMLYPMIESFRLSMTRGSSERFVGFDNYSRVLTSETFYHAVYNTLYITVFQLLIALPVGFIIACLINSLSKGKNFFKVMFYLPNVTSMVAAATVFLAVLHPEGLLNFALSKLGFSTTIWLAHPITAKWGVILLSVWNWLGFVIIINLANLQSISTDYYEAASVDGATRFQQWRYITIPNMTGSLGVLFIVGWIGGLQRFSDAYMLGGLQGSPARSLHTIVGFVFERGFGGHEYGLASAASYVLFVFILFITFLNTKLSKMKI